MLLFVSVNIMILTCIRLEVKDRLHAYCGTSWFSIRPILP